MADRVTTRAPSRQRDGGTGEPGRLAEQLGQLHGGGAWHGPAVGEALAGLNAAHAARRLIGSAHSIREIVHHLRVTTDQVHRSLTGQAPSGEADWPALTDGGETAWREAVDGLKAAQLALRHAVASFPAGRLHETIPGKDHSYWHELLGVLHHDAYHAGQISLLRKKEDAHAAWGARARSPEVPESADAYGWLVGSWELDVRHFWTDVRGRGLTGEAHFAWVLEGRAVQDVWIMPRRGARSGEPDRSLNMFGTTLRVWDPALQAWRVTWTDPVSGSRAELVGRRQGEEVVQVGTFSDGTPIRWIFTDVAPDSFRWIGESLEPDGRTWTLRGEFLARRTPS